MKIKIPILMILAFAAVSMAGCSSNTSSSQTETSITISIDDTNVSENIEETSTESQQEIQVDFENAESFENALNNGEDLTGKIVTFIADNIEPQSAFGYNIWAGEHLNFVSSQNPDVFEGDTVTVKVTEITSSLGSWIIKYEKIFSDSISINSETSTATSSSSEVSETTIFEETQNTSESSIDFENAESFENALNNSENLVGKVVRFTADELKPQSVYGYDIWAGEHLNFVSSQNPDVKKGDIVTVKITEVTSSLGSWIIEYEKISCESNPINTKKTVEESDYFGTWNLVRIEQDDVSVTIKELENQGDTFFSNSVLILKNNGTYYFTSGYGDGEIQNWTITDHGINCDGDDMPYDNETGEIMLDLLNGSKLYYTKSSSSQEFPKAQAATTETSSTTGEQTTESQAHVTVPNEEETEGQTVWVPTNGGTKYHSKSTCSNMKDPIRVSLETAEQNGYTPCARCH